MGRAGVAVKHPKPLKVRVSLRSLVRAHEESTGSKATLGIIEEMVTADAVSSKRMASLDLLIPDGRWHRFAERLKRAWSGQLLWGVPIKQLLVVVMVIGALAGVLLGLATFDSRAYWRLIGLIPG